MSSFKIEAKHKESGNVQSVWCIDGYFGGRNYGYIPQLLGATAMREEHFYREYEPVETSHAGR